MRTFIAIFFPFFAFFTIGRPLAGIICFVLQITLLGWLPAALWAVIAVNRYYVDERIAQTLQNNTLKGENPQQ